MLSFVNTFLGQGSTAADRPGTALVESLQVSSETGLPDPFLFGMLLARMESHRHAAAHEASE